ncbi:hypothetical protein [Pseudomonas panipatensis]|uniref:hypothetical protein n=1 Tax=Pseudomonas panipatensis TaxID=428992 RepID=UPI0035B03753
MNRSPEKFLRVVEVSSSVSRYQAFLLLGINESKGRVNKKGCLMAAFFVSG